MKCPKCQYISFDNRDRCRNCGYEFSLAVADTPVDLPMQDAAAPDGPLSDFSLQDLDTTFDAAASPVPPRSDAPFPTPSGGGFDLPLFGRGSWTESAAVPANSTPRAPLAVRRATLSAPRPRPRQPGEEPRLALDSPDPRAANPRTDSQTGRSDAGRPDLASHGARLLAASLDLLLTGAIDVAVLYFTLRLCGLTFADTPALPMVPLLAFLVLLNGGYFASFVAANGQTVGKMAAGIRVIPADPDASARARVPFGTAVVRAAAYAVSLAPAGVGLLPAFLTPDRRALHDRLADTRVVKA